MKPIIMFLVLLFAGSFLLGQELKTKKKKSYSTTEVYHIDKKTKTREGNCYKLFNLSKDTLAKGQYSDNVPKGIWTFFDKGNRRFLVFDFNRDSCLWVDPIVCQKDSFPVRDGEKFRFEILDRPPLFLGYRREFDYHLASDLKLPVYIMQNGMKLSVATCFVINKSGDIEDLQIVGGLKNEITKLIMDTNHQWIPGMLKGRPVDTKLYIIFTFAPATEIQKMPESPFLKRVYFSYWSETRIHISNTIH